MIRYEKVEGSDREVRVVIEKQDNQISLSAAVTSGDIWGMRQLGLALKIHLRSLLSNHVRNLYCLPVSQKSDRLQR